jgi:hypothetical protein
VSTHPSNDQRNPLRDPRKGDIVRKGELLRTVTDRRGNDIWYVSNGRKKSGLVWISTWRSWCCGAEVVTDLSALEQGHAK